MLLRKTLLLIGTSFFIAAPTTFAADMIEASDPEAILQVAKIYGSARLTEDSYGDPMIKGRIDGNRYSVIFDGCDDGADCKFIILTAGWVYPGIEIEALNEWNYYSNFGKAYIDDEGDPILEFAINLDYGGVSEKNLSDSFDWWQIILADFVTQFID